MPVSLKSQTKYGDVDFMNGNVSAYLQM